MIMHLVATYHFALAFMLLIGGALAVYAIPQDFKSHADRHRTGLYSAVGGASEIFGALLFDADAAVKASMWSAAFSAVEVLILVIVLYEMCHMQEAGYRLTPSGRFVKNYRWRGAPRRYPAEEDAL